MFAFCRKAMLGGARMSCLVAIRSRFAAEVGTVGPSSAPESAVVGMRL